MSILDKLSGRGCESTLTALITRWQKGFRNHPFRHIRFLGFSRISGSKRGKIVQLSVKVSVTAAAVQGFSRNPAPFGETPPLLFNGF
jgi:hypothetical protein